MANFDGEFFGLVFPGFQATQKNSCPKFTSRIVGIPLQFHFLEPKIYSRRFSAYGGDQYLEDRMEYARASDELDVAKGKIGVTILPQTEVALEAMEEGAGRLTNLGSWNHSRPQS